MFRLYASLALLTTVVLGAFFEVGQPTSVHACTGGPGPFVDWAANAPAIVIAEAVSVGGPENTAPTVTPTPMPSATPLPRPSGDVRAVSLAGIGAHLGVVQVVAGTETNTLDVDGSHRQRIEQDLRRLEADPNLLLPCPLDFLVERYEAGRTYFLVLGFEEGPGWYTYVQWEIDGSDVISGGADYVDGRQAIAVSRAVLDAYFPGLPATTGGAPAGVEANWIIEQQRVPVDMLVAAVQGVRSGAVTLTAEPTQAPASGGGIFTPPDTGDAGLR